MVPLSWKICKHINSIALLKQRLNTDIAKLLMKYDTPIDKACRTVLLLKIMSISIFFSICCVRTPYHHVYMTPLTLLKIKNNKGII